MKIPDEARSGIESEKQRLVLLNEEMGKRERNADRDFFEGLLSDGFIFRRANGDVVNKDKYLRALDEVPGNPYEQLDTHVREVRIDKDSAVATVLVTAKRKNMGLPGKFLNVRMFVLDHGEWKLEAWINTRQD